VPNETPDVSTTASCPQTQSQDQLSLWAIGPSSPPGPPNIEARELARLQFQLADHKKLLAGALKTGRDLYAEVLRLRADLEAARPPIAGPSRCDSLTARGRLAPVVDEVPFTAGRWELAKGGRSVNLPQGGKIRQEAAPKASPAAAFRYAANMRLVQAAPALYALAEDFSLFLRDGGAVEAERQQLTAWISALETWVRTGEEIFDETTGAFRVDDVGARPQLFCGDEPKETDLDGEELPLGVDDEHEADETAP